MERDISPPRSKRRRLNVAGDSTVSFTPYRLAVYSWNVNGIAPFIQQSITSFFKHESENHKGQARNPPQASLRDFLRRHEWPTVLCLQEVKINPEDTGTIHAVEKAIRKTSRDSSDEYDYEAHFCLPSDTHNARGFGRKVYGVCTIIRKDFKEQYIKDIHSVSWDKEGRVLVAETKATAYVPKLALFNVYAVNGTDHPYKDPENGAIIGTRHDRKLKFHTSLQAECRSLEAEGFRVIIAGDINIARSVSDAFPNLRTFPKQHCVNRADFEARFFADLSEEVTERNSAKHVDAGLGMIDTFRYLHPEKRSYTFYPRTKTFGESCDRVDMVIISSCLRDNLKSAGMHEAASERGPSDHVPLYAQLEFEQHGESCRV